MPGRFLDVFHGCPLTERNSQVQKAVYTANKEDTNDLLKVSHVFYNIQ
jgi:hypothetical protein